ncbi:hypothetical protein [Salipaludibacillus aurantiacus]|nr:hypothetical protein [Salipaludibacillus aurantiacus]
MMKKTAVAGGLLLIASLAGCSEMTNEEEFQADVKGQAINTNFPDGYFHLFVKDSFSDHISFQNMKELDNDYETEIYLIALTENTAIYHSNFENPQSYKNLPEDSLYVGNEIEINFEEDFSPSMQKKSTDYEDIFALNPVYTANEIFIHNMTLADVKKLHSPEKGKAAITVLDKEPYPVTSEDPVMKQINELREKRELNLSVRDYSVSGMYLHESYFDVEELDFSHEPTYLFTTGDGEIKTTGDQDEAVEWLRAFGEKNDG